MQSHAPETYKTKNPDTSVLKTAHFSLTSGYTAPCKNYTISSCEQGS